MQNHLFEGFNPIEVKAKTRSKYQQWKVENNYRKSDSPMVRCEFCSHCMYIPKRNGRRYYKCELLGYSFCAATDIRLSSVCNLFESEDKECAKES